MIAWWIHFGRFEKFSNENNEKLIDVGGNCVQRVYNTPEKIYTQIVRSRFLGS